MQTVNFNGTINGSVFAGNNGTINNEFNSAITCDAEIDRLLTQLAQHEQTKQEAQELINSYAEFKTADLDSKKKISLNIKSGIEKLLNVAGKVEPLLSMALQVAAIMTTSQGA